jgi:hypothetical protein
MLQLMSLMFSIHKFELLGPMSADTGSTVMRESLFDSVCNPQAIYHLWLILSRLK